MKEFSVDPIQIILIVVAIAVVLGAGPARVVRSRSRRALPERARPGLKTPSARPGLGDRLAKSRHSMGERLRSVLGRSVMDEEFWLELEEALLAADVGLVATTEVVEAVRRRHPEDGSAARAILRDELLEELADQDRTVHRFGKPAVIVVVGVNGVGKTTTIAKLAARLREDGAEALLGAADTFRAAADTQLRTWADRVGTEIVSAEPGSDPASVAFDAYTAARTRGKDVVIVDTAGRLHSKANLMAELGKIVRVLEKEAGKIDEVLLVLDATTGQNGLAQARQFTESVGVTGIVLTKMDGTAKGGIVIGVEKDLSIPVKFIGVGEGVDDLIPFEPEAFIDALLGEV